MRTPGRQFHDDPKRRRFVVYCTRRGVAWRTSVRYGAKRTKGQARELAERLALKLSTARG